MKVGMAEVNITPPLGMQLPGYGPKPRQATGVKDELFAKAMVVESSDDLFALIAIDIISLNLEYNDRIRNRVHEYTGISPENIMIACTHTHTGPTRPIDDAALSYYPTFEAKVADAAIVAFAKREEATIGYGRGMEDSVNFNRRFFMKDGKVQTNPGVLNPDIVKPEGPIDPEIVVVRIDNAQGEPLGIISNYALHTDCVGGTEYSGDFPAHISRTIKQQFGKSVVSLFLMGTSGNINHIDVTGRIKRKPDRHIEIGNILGLEISKVRNKINTNNEGEIKIKSKFVDVKERALMKHEIEEAHKVLSMFEHVPEEKMDSKEIMDKARAENRLKIKDKSLSSREYEIQICAIGDLAIVALPAEMFVEFGLEIKEKSPYSHTIVTELSNGSDNGYVCTRIAYEHGGYESMGTKFAVDAGEVFTQTAIDILEEIRS